MIQIYIALVVIVILGALISKIIGGIGVILLIAFGVYLILSGKV
jgi:hypothetical protein